MMPVSNRAHRDEDDGLTHKVRIGFNSKISLISALVFALMYCCSPVVVASLYVDHNISLSARILVMHVYTWRDVYTIAARYSLPDLVSQGAHSLRRKKAGKRHLNLTEIPCMFLRLSAPPRRRGDSATNARTQTYSHTHTRALANLFKK